MTLNRLNLAVTDVPQVQQFLTTHFGLQPVTDRRKALAKPNPALTALRDDAGLVLTLSNFDRAAEASYPGHFHIGLVRASEAAVDALSERLRADGLEASAPRCFHGS